MANPRCYKCEVTSYYLSCSFSLQGLLLPPGFILILLFFSAGIISTVQIHLYLALFLRRDYFCRPDSSLSCSFSPQGLLLPPGFIPSLLFFSVGIISAVQMHLYLALFFRRDYFFRPDSSLSCSFSPWGLFPPPGFIPSLLFPPQGLLPPPGFISILLLRATGIISAARIHPQLALFHHRDYCDHPDSSLSYSSVPQGLFLPLRCISILLFFTTGITSVARIHLYLAFFSAGIISDCDDPP